MCQCASITIQSQQMDHTNITTYICVETTMTLCGCKCVGNECVPNLFPTWVTAAHWEWWAGCMWTQTHSETSIYPSIYPGGCCQINRPFTLCGRLPQFYRIKCVGQLMWQGSPFYEYALIYHIPPWPWSFTLWIDLSFTAAYPNYLHGDELSDYTPERCAKLLPSALHRRSTPPWKQPIISLLEYKHPATDRAM